MKSKIIWIAGLLILVVSCQKRKYPADDIQLEKQAIYFNGTVDNNPILLKIGSDGYYCYSSYVQSADSVYIFRGDLKKFNCNPCPLSLVVELTDYRQRLPGSSVPVDSALKTGSRKLISGSLQIQRVKFASHSNKGVSSTRWDFSNGDSRHDTVFIYDFTQPGLQTVSLTVYTTEGCESIVTNNIFVGGETGLFACSIATDPVQNNHAQFYSNSVGGKGHLSYNWDFGDGGTSTLAAPPHDYEYAGSYPVKLQIKDEEGHICESNYIHVTGKDKSSCAANMSLSIGGGTNTFLNGVRMQWTDQSNVVLRSDSVDQPAESYFEIVNSQAYEPNEQGESGRLLTVRFNLLLSDGKRNVWIKSENTAITVAYK